MTTSHLRAERSPSRHRQHRSHDSKKPPSLGRLITKEPYLDERCTERALGSCQQDNLEDIARLGPASVLEGCFSLFLLLSAMQVIEHFVEVKFHTSAKFMMPHLFLTSPFSPRWLFNSRDHFKLIR